MPFFQSSLLHDETFLYSIPTTGHFFKKKGIYYYIFDEKYTCFYLHKFSYDMNHDILFLKKKSQIPQAEMAICCQDMND